MTGRDKAKQGKKPSNYEALNEHYDLIMVGAGMSGLAAARFYQKKINPDAKILIMDNYGDFGDKRDFLDDLSLTETWEYINSVSYNWFLPDHVGLEETSLPVMNAMLVYLTGMSGWNLSALEGISQGGPGIKSLGRRSRTTASIAGKFIGSLLNVEMFPDGNASIARLLVQKLNSAVAPNM